MVIVTREPEGEEIAFEKLTTVQQLLNRLGERVNSVLVIRDGTLLTPDRRLRDGDTVIVRSVRSRG